MVVMCGLQPGSPVRFHPGASWVQLLSEAARRPLGSRCAAYREAWRGGADTAAACRIGRGVADAVVRGKDAPRGRIALSDTAVEIRSGRGGVACTAEVADRVVGRHVGGGARGDDRAAGDALCAGRQWQTQTREFNQRCSSPQAAKACAAACVRACCAHMCWAGRRPAQCALSEIERKSCITNERGTSRYYNDNDIVVTAAIAAWKRAYKGTHLQPLPGRPCSAGGCP